MYIPKLLINGTIMNIFVISLAALFMLRNPKFLDQVPEEYKKVFVDGNPVAPEKLQVLKQMISKKFPVSNFCKYFWL